MHTLELFKMGFVILLSVILIGHSVQAQYYSYRTGNGSGGRNFGALNCPLKCRCLAIDLLEQRMNDLVWQFDGFSEETGTVHLNPTPLRGTDVVCSGIDIVPSGIPDGKCFTYCLSGSGCSLMSNLNLYQHIQSIILNKFESSSTC